MWKISVIKTLKKKIFQTAIVQTDILICGGVFFFIVTFKLFYTRTDVTAYSDRGLACTFQWIFYDFFFLEIFVNDLFMYCTCHTIMETKYKYY